MSNFSEGAVVVRAPLRPFEVDLLVPKIRNAAGVVKRILPNKKIEVLWSWADNETCLAHYTSDQLEIVDSRIIELLSYLKQPRFVEQTPQTGSALWELRQLVEAGKSFPPNEIKFIESLLHGHFEQVEMAKLLLATIEGGDDES